MLKASIGLSRKLSQDFNSLGFTISLESEIFARLDDTDAVLHEVKYLYDLADAALQEQIDRRQGCLPPTFPVSISSGNRSQAATVTVSSSQRQRNDQGGENRFKNGTSGQAIPATAKQISFLKSICERNGWSQATVHQELRDILRNDASIESLTKQEAGVVLEKWTAGQASAKHKARQTG